MKLNITVKPNSKKTAVVNNAGSITVHLKSSPIDNKANLELIKTLAKLYKVPQSSINIKHGSTGRKKLIEIID